MIEDLKDDTLIEKVGGRFKLTSLIAPQLNRSALGSYARLNARMINRVKQ